MANIHISNRFSALQNVKSISWSGSLRYNLVRYFACSLIFASIASSVIGSEEGAKSAAGVFAGLALGFPLLTLFFVVPISIVMRQVVRVFPYAGPFWLFMTLFTCIGDPLIWFASLFVGKTGWFQSLVPVETPPFFSFNPFVYVIRPEVGSEVYYSGQIPVEDVGGQGFDARRA